MSLLDDARRLADSHYPSDDQGYCLICDGAHSEDHKPDCPWLQMPKIVAALEAADRLTRVLGDRFPTEVEEGADDTYAIAWACCGGNFYSPHMAHCPWRALVVALKGDAP